MRVGDREREHVVEVLRLHAAEGRLDPEELEARIDAAYAARMQADLEPLTRDLPAPRAEPPRLRRPTADGLHDFWPRWVLIVSTVGLLTRVFGVASRR